jgi:hypothetical protein
MMIVPTGAPVGASIRGRRRSGFKWSSDALQMAVSEPNRKWPVSWGDSGAGCEDRTRHLMITRLVLHVPTVRSPVRIVLLRVEPFVDGSSVTRAIRVTVPLARTQPALRPVCWPAPPLGDCAGGQHVRLSSDGRQ